MPFFATGGIPEPSFGRPRTLVHPGPRADVRLEHATAHGGRQLRISLPAGTGLHEGLTRALASAGVQAAAIALVGGDLAEVAYCLPIPDPEGQLMATYGEPHVLRGASLLRGSATLGQDAQGLPVIHCHASFADAEGAVRGGHVLTPRTVVGQRPVTALVSVLDGVALRLGFDAETRLNMLRPNAQPGESGATT
jgi:predicted DNA-binding protein with PD1-like motif